jgi:Mg-chelatase subunit ChlD
MKTKFHSLKMITFAAVLALAGFANAKSIAPSATATTKPAKPRIEVCFVLDTTGSMGGLIEGAKQKIWSIANEMIAAKPAPDIRVGLVAYRDHGDEYVTKTFDLTNDMDLVYAKLHEFQAGGGGDEPESVNEALDAAVCKMAWSQDRAVLKIIFLVGDAPPHMDYTNDTKYPQVCQSAMKRDLIINTVQCGSIASTTPIWQEIAKLSEGSYAAIGQSGNMVAIATPMDAELGKLNAAVNGTVIAYGDARRQREVASKVAYSMAAAAPAAADRLSFNASSGKTVQGEGELLDAIKDGSVSLESIKKAELPVEYQKLSDEDFKAKVAEKQKERSELQAQIAKLSGEREQFIAAERKRLAAAGKVDSFDEKVAEMIHAEAARKGISYSK